MAVGKDEVGGSNPPSSSRGTRCPARDSGFLRRECRKVPGDLAPRLHRISPVNGHDGLGDGLPPLDVVAQGHGGGGVSRRRLGQLDVLGLVIEVRQHGGAEADGRDVLREARVPLDAAAHPPDLGVGHGLPAAEEEFPLRNPGQVGDGQGREADGPGTAQGFGALDLGLVAGGMGDGPADVDFPVFRVDVPALEAQDLLQPEGMQGQKRQPGPVRRKLDVADVPDQEPHLLHAVGHRGPAGLARDPDPLGPERVFQNQAVLHGGVQDLIQHQLDLVLGALGPRHAVEEALHVVGGDVLQGQPPEGGEDVAGQLPPVGDGRAGLHVGPGVGLEPVHGVLGEGVPGGFRGAVLHARQTQQLVGVLLLRAGMDQAPDAVDGHRAGDFRRFGPSPAAGPPAAPLDEVLQIPPGDQRIPPDFGVAEFPGPDEAPHQGGVRPQDLPGLLEREQVGPLL